MPETSSHITTSGGLLTQSFIDAIREEATDRPHTSPSSFEVPWEEAPSTQRKLEDDIAGAWELLKERWDSLQQEYESLNDLDVTTTRERWLLPLFRLLDFEPEYQRADLQPTDDEDLRFKLSHRGWTPDGAALHLVEPEQDLDQRQGTGRGPKAKSPHDMLQVFLNVSEPDLWAVLSNGRFLRLLRDYHHTFSKGYVQFDLESIFEARNYADFRALYRLCHASRFRPTDGEEEQIPLEDFHQTARATGVKIGEDLRPQVREAIEHLGNGFLRGEPELIEELRGDPDAAQDFYSEILRVVYRILFLLFAEQRGLVPDADAPSKDLYWSDYSLTALRERAESGVPNRDDHTDLWHGLQATFKMVRKGAEDLGVFGYNGELFEQMEGYVSGRACDNARLLRAIRALTLIEREGVLQRISYLDLGVEELGSVYESLLDFTPQVTDEPKEIEGREVRANTFILDPRGLERKQTGSYYTPDSLVNELVKSALLPVMRDRLEDEGLPVVEEDDLGEVTTGLLDRYADLSDEERGAGEAAILDMDVCDPAAGSGHFLVKANNVMGAEVARLRSGDEYPTERKVREAKREVLARCIYAVDLNPMAVELCKVSLWINASVQDRPLSFLDHHIKQGNSLIGATPELLEDGVPYEAFPTKSKSRSGDDGDTSKAFREKTKTERKESKRGQGVQMGAFSSATTTEPRVSYEAGNFEQVAQEKPKQARQIYAEYERDEERRQAKLEADMYTAAFFWPMSEGTEWAPTYGELFRVQREGRGAIPDEHRAHVEEMAENYNFFHWHLEFPEVFGEDGDGGFDVVLGNPPWEQIQLEEKEFFAKKAPDIATAPTASKRKNMISELEEAEGPLFDEYQQAHHFSEALGTYLKESGRYDLTAVGRINVYQIFAGLVRSIVGSTGRTGLVVPSGIATDYYTRDYFNTIVKERELVSLFDFENREKLFHGVDNRTKFCLLTLTGSGAPERSIDFAFFLTQPEQLSEETRHFTLTREELYTINPNTGTCPTFRSKQDAELTKKLYKSTSVLIEEEPERNPWDVSLKQGLFNMTSDSQIAKNREDLEERGCDLTADHRFECGKKEYLPVYEGKMVETYNHRSADILMTDNPNRPAQPNPIDPEELTDPELLPRPIQWIDQQEVESRIPGYWQYSWTPTFKRVTSPTNHRTVVGPILPYCAVSYTLIAAYSKVSNAPHMLCLPANLWSFTFDFCMRNKLSQPSIPLYVVKETPVIEPDRYTSGLLMHIVPRVLELTYTAWDLAAFADDVWSESDADLRASIKSQWQSNVEATDGGHRGKSSPEWVDHSDQADEHFPHQPFMWDEERRAQLRADLDGLYGHLYGLEREELSYILDTFPIVERQDKEEYGEYRTKRLVLEAYDELAGTALVDGHGSQGESTYTLTDIDLHDLDDEADQEEVEDAFEDLQTDLDEDPSLTDEDGTQETSATTRSRSEAFRVGVRKIYDHKCTVCGVEAYGPGDGSTVVDAAHIYPKSEGGADDLRNGLCLCKQHHWAFDEGWFTVTDDHTVRVHPNLPDDSDYDFIREHDGDTLHLPDDERFHPHPLFLEARRELVGETFDTSEVS
ncbi:HNH endonuclease [Salinibacter ruber]|uniref:HNH endonuclease n=1 Tax=Salinibacter ruber TaxID=146919 RepID=UPI000E56BDB6|nr:HNH endonuclease [Salinibacter ruber]